MDYDLPVVNPYYRVTPKGFNSYIPSSHSFCHWIRHHKNVILRLYQIKLFPDKRIQKTCISILNAKQRKKACTQALKFLNSKGFFSHNEFLSNYINNCGCQALVISCVVWLVSSSLVGNDTAFNSRLKSTRVFWKMHRERNICFTYSQA